MTKRSGNLRRFTALTAFSLSEKVIAFIYQAIIAAVLGAGVVTDCYFSASQLFDLIDSTVLGALVVVIINRYANISAETDEKTGIRFLSKLNTLLSAVMAVLAIITFIFAKPFSYMIAPGFDEAARPGLVRCIRILSVLPPIMVFATLAQGLLRQKKCFIAVNSRSLFISLCGMAVVLLLSTKHPENSDFLCFGYVAANLLFSLLLFVRSRKFGAIGFAKPTFDKDTKQLFRMAVPAIISKGIIRVSLMIDQIVASTLGQGSVSYLSYAHSLYNVVSSLLIVNMCMIILTDLTNLCVANEYDKMIKKVDSAVNSTVLLLAPITLLTMCFSTEIVSIAYERGAFNAGSSAAVGSLLLFYAIGFVPAMLNAVYTQVLHSFGKMNIAMRNSLISFGLNITLNLILSRLIGLIGIALATAISGIAVIPLYYFSAKKHLKDYEHIFKWKFLLKIACALAACGAVIVPAKLFIKSPIFSFAVAVVGGFIIFAAILILLKEETLMGYLSVIKGRGKKHDRLNNTDS